MNTSSSEGSSRGVGRKKRKKKRGSSMNRVHPEGSSGEVSQQNGYVDEPEMAKGREMSNNNNGQQDRKLTIDNAADAFNVMSNVKKGAERFKGLSCRRRQMGENASMGIDDSIMPQPLQRNRFNEALISYFARMARSDIDEEVIDLEFVQQMLDSGADITCTDKHGQTVLHEAVRAWEIDVALFLLARGAKVNQKDRFGRTPLHVAAAVNYPEMVMMLLDNDYENADIEVLTDGELQTPLHFAARNDANMALKTLLKQGANLHARDYKGRTPLQVAAELDRSETARQLLELGSDASDTDKTGQTSLVLLISKMPAVAKEGLDQFHRCDRANRKQYYDHHYVEPIGPDDPKPKARSAIQVIVQYNQLELITHPVIKRLLHVKWVKFGRRGACIQALINFVFILLWTVVAVTLREDKLERYNLPADTWRIVIWILSLLITVYMIILELQEFFTSKKKFQRWKQWREGEIEKDLEFCHPQWPQEKNFLLQEIEEINNQSPAYFSEFWNYFDWIVYCVLLIFNGMFIASQFIPDGISHDRLVGFARRFMAISIILIWLRFMKTARAFKSIGPFIVMLGHILGDVFKFGFLYLEFYIPYACAFWMIFGNNEGIPSMQTVDSLLFSLFRITLVDEYDYEGMHGYDTVMAYILVSTFLFLSALLCINLLIALLSDTFQRVYDNANSNAAMQQASIILGIEEGLSKKQLRKFRRHIHEKAGPEVLYYDDDQTVEGESDLKKVTFQIKDELDDMKEHLFNHLNIGGLRKNNGDSLDEIAEHLHDNQSHLQDSEAVNVRSLQEELTRLGERQQRSNRNVQKQLKTMNEILQALLIAQSSSRGAPGPINPGGVTPRPPIYITQPSLPTGRLGGGDLDEDEYELSRMPRYVGRHRPVLSPLMQGSRSRSQSLVDNSLATQRTFLESDAPQPLTQVDNSAMEAVNKERLKVFREERKKKLKQRKQQEDYLQQQQAEVMIPMSEVKEGQDNHEVKAPSELSRQMTREEDELSDLVKFRTIDKDIEKQEMSDDNDTKA
ncbi:uncharacterized protein LOC117304686 isoform X3 [Asterias rubens]|uniref:uncharacterized protein LOC117304686 isoform X3 n=1 Tax=Asterias rubens TaxID=7604 RepID=UPI0014556D33|nr:uncharacterized protein LOC117304686 isoform X3 [Asterias rubens]